MLGPASRSLWLPGDSGVTWGEQSSCWVEPGCRLQPPCLSQTFESCPGCCKKGRK